MAWSLLRGNALDYSFNLFANYFSPAYGQSGTSGGLLYSGKQPAFREAACIPGSRLRRARTIRGHCRPWEKQHTTRGRVGPPYPLPWKRVPRAPQDSVPAGPQRSLLHCGTRVATPVIECGCGLPLAALCTCFSRLLKHRSHLGRGGIPISQEQGGLRGRRQFRYT